MRSSGQCVGLAAIATGVGQHEVVNQAFWVQRERYKVIDVGVLDLGAAIEALAVGELA